MGRLLRSTGCGVTDLSGQPLMAEVTFPPPPTAAVLCPVASTALRLGAREWTARWRAAPHSTSAAPTAHVWSPSPTRWVACSRSRCSDPRISSELVQRGCNLRRSTVRGLGQRCPIRLKETLHDCLCTTWSRRCQGRVQSPLRELDLSLIH